MRHQFGYICLCALRSALALCCRTNPRMYKPWPASQMKRGTAAVHASGCVYTNQMKCSRVCVQSVEKIPAWQRHTEEASFKYIEIIRQP